LQSSTEPELQNAHRCVVPLYTPTPTYEFKWMVEVMFASLPKCGCSIQLRDQSSLLEDLGFSINDSYSKLKYPKHLFISVLLNPTLTVAMFLKNSAFEEYRKYNVTVFHLGDEKSEADFWYYKNVRAVYRNYYTSDQNRLSD